jgi:hypothetical protein
VVTGEEEPDKVGPGCQRKREKSGYRFGIVLDGLGAGSGAGPKWLPEAQF